MMKCYRCGQDMEVDDCDAENAKKTPCVDCVIKEGEEVTGHKSQRDSAIGPVDYQGNKVGEGRTERPRPEWVRGKCPQCGDDLVSNCYYIGGRGYIVCWECWSSLKKDPTCDYRHTL